jgi:hypothetical protein
MNQNDSYVDIDTRLLESQIQLSCSIGDMVEVEHDSPFKNFLLHIRITEIRGQTVFGEVTATLNVVDPDFPINKKVCFSKSKIRARQ